MISHNTDKLLPLRIGGHLQALRYFSQAQKNLPCQALPITFILYLKLPGTFVCSMTR